MSLPTQESTIDGLYLSSYRRCEPYEPSVVSSSSSSQASVFSDPGSVQSSISSSTSDDFRHSHEEARDRACAQAQIRQQALHSRYNAPLEQAKAGDAAVASTAPAPSYADVTAVPPELRQHPRRSSLARNQRPPQLQRQQDRKTHFVDSLVDSAAQMVEVIWPLSVVPCRSEAGTGRGVLPLRTYIEETLRRSRTSYSTLQVALYYLVLIRPFVPSCDFTREPQMDSSASRALMCGRRMFLSALILASKYLQDRNYSAKAWSKMSGLSIDEINTNERTFLDKVAFKLHIPDPIFKKWTEIVLKYTPNAHPPSPGQGFGLVTSSWKNIISHLTPDLDRIPIPDSKSTPLAECGRGVYGCSTPTTPTPVRSALGKTGLGSISHESTPTPTAVPPPRFLEPKPDLVPPTPALARMGPLPTPQLTPSSVASSTPAASVCGSRRPSMCSAMSIAQKTGFGRCVVDAFPCAVRDFYPASRRPSITSIASARSSPESMITDRSRSSRASSISSASTVSSAASLAPNRAGLARQATCRNARLPMPPATVAEEEKEGPTSAGQATRVTTASDDGIDLTSSPEVTNFSISSEKALHAPHKHSKLAAHHHSATSASSGCERGRKRCRSRGQRRSDLHEEVRLILEEDLDSMMDIDDISGEDEEGIISPSPAADYATRMLGTYNPAGSDTTSKEIQPPVSLSRRGSCRMPVQRKHDGKKRTCCSTAMSLSSSLSPSPSRLYAEV